MSGPEKNETRKHRLPWIGKHDIEIVKSVLENKLGNDEVNKTSSQQSLLNNFKKKLAEHLAKVINEIQFEAKPIQSDNVLYSAFNQVYGAKIDIHTIFSVIRKSLVNELMSKNPPITKTL